MECVALSVVCATSQKTGASGCCASTSLPIKYLRKKKIFQLLAGRKRIDFVPGTAATPGVFETSYFSGPADVAVGR